MTSNPILFYIWTKRKQGAKHSDLNWKHLRGEYDYCEEIILLTSRINPEANSSPNSNPRSPSIKE